MPEFKFDCPHCRKHISAEGEWAGMAVECPHCSVSITIPFPPPPKPSEADAAKAASPGPDEKLCPECGKTIKREAVFCRHCKQPIQEKAAKSTCKCPLCCETFQTEADHVGKEMYCPVCGQSITYVSVPLLRKAPPAESAAPDAVPLLRKAPPAESAAPGAVSPGGLEFRLWSSEFTISGDYPTVYALVRRALEEHGCQIQTDNPERGLLIFLAPNCKYPTLYAIFSQRTNHIILEIQAADLTRRQTLCNRIAAQISDIFTEYKAGRIDVKAVPRACPPKYADREGINLEKQAKFYLLLGLGGFLFCPIVILTFAVHVMLLKRNTESQNKNGRALIVAGFAIDTVVIFVICMYALYRAGL
ncbi:MAG: hypothetical protein HPZ91_04410 [Lentisphaeria bacterium]|nr:hypothetical protein [Lentisphaeria bacterium]